MNRRKFFHLAGGSLAAITTGLVTAPTFAESALGKPFKAKFAPHLNLLPTAPKGFVDQLKFAYDLGFRAWEENWLSSQEPKIQEQVGAFAKEHDMHLGVTVITGGKGVKFFNASKEDEKVILDDMKKGVELVKRTGQTHMTMIPGPRDESMPRERADRKGCRSHEALL